MAALLRNLRRFADAADAVSDLFGRCASWLVLFVIAALFAQWPLREWLGRGHILANDFGQIGHAVVFSIGIAYAMRWDGHVRLDVFYQRMTARRRALVGLLGTLCCVLPWIAIVLWFSWPMMLQSVRQHELFPETYSPGYFLFKILLTLFAALVTLQAFGNVARNLALLLDRGTGAPTTTAEHA
jgi:TRAP-type mannitol/chloroaromatic compound transport system permease small subunit